MERDFNIHQWQAKYLKEEQEENLNTRLQKHANGNPAIVILNALQLAKEGGDMYEISKAVVQVLNLQYRD